MKTIRPERKGMFPMPSLLGKTPKQAEETLAEEGKRGTMDVQETDCDDESVKEGTICGQTPEPGQTTQSGPPTVVYIQKQRNPKIPDVREKSVEQATQIMNQAGFHKVTVLHLTDPRKGCSQELICTTSPEAGVRNSPDLEVRLWLPPVPDDDIGTTTSPTAERPEQPDPPKPPDPPPPKDIF